MATSRDGKSSKYVGIYWKNVKRLDGSGMERLYYIVYRRGGRGSKLIEELVGRASQGMTEALANRERAARINGKLSNSERREQDKVNRLISSGPLTINRMWEIFLEAYSNNRSIRDDINRYKKHVVPPLANVLTSELETSHIEALRHRLEKVELSPQSVKHCLGLVKRIVRYASQFGIFQDSRNIHFEMPKVDNLKTENMDPTQLLAYLNALDDEPDQDAAALLRLALVTGIRRGALFALKWTDCDFDNCLITLDAQAARKILLSLTHISEYVFPGKDGGLRKSFDTIARRVREKAGLPKSFRPVHGLRHVFASQFASSGQVDLYTLQKLLTHGSAAMTQRYAHLADETLRKAANVANALARPSEEK